MAPTSQVSLVRCEAYHSNLSRALDELLAPLGGISAFVQRGQRVLIKPNLLTDRGPQCAVTTHPEVVRAVIRAVRDGGGIPSVGDSPASAVKLSRVHDQTGIAALCADEGVELLNLESAGSVTVDAGRHTFRIAKPVAEADVLINLPKVKTHVLTVLTGAVKNIYGVLPGYQKAHFHRSCPKVRDFGRLLTSLHQCVTPALNIADGILAMEGDGPSGGDPVQLGLLAASTDAYALDRTLCDILKIPANSVPYLDTDNGAPPAFPPTLFGPPIETLRPEHFRIPGTLTARLIPAGLIRLLEPFLWVRPELTDACVACGRCAEACPASALEMRPGERPILLPKQCIGCCCCHEVCPAGAIHMTLSPLLGLLRRGRILSP